MFPFLPAEIEALWLSLRVSLSAALIILAPSVLLGYVMAYTSFWGKGLLNVICHLPLVLPPVVVGYFLLLLFGREGFFGALLYEHFGFHLALHESGAVIACAAVSFPLLLRMSRAAFHLSDPKLREAALSLGARPWRVFFTVILPQAWPGILAGFVLAWGRTLGEFGATVTFVSNLAGHTRTLPLAIYTQMQSPQPEAEASALRLLTLSVLLSIVCLGLSEWLQKSIRKRHSTWI